MHSTIGLNMKKQSQTQTAKTVAMMQVQQHLYTLSSTKCQYCPGIYDTQSSEEFKAQLVLNATRAQQDVCLVEKTLTDCIVQQNIALGRLYQFEATEAERKLQDADIDISYDFPTGNTESRAVWCYVTLQKSIICTVPATAVRCCKLLLFPHFFKQANSCLAGQTCMTRTGQRQQSCRICAGQIPGARLFYDCLACLGYMFYVGF
ncbi:hypothetical protein F4604DRAFT_1691493 [Suillus subluteus]|nr:hypothetical protein F4604DRAFT_1691493 [Suillus subluteus]